MPFQPVPLYPHAIDTDRTLFVVYNTTETRLSANNSPWALEIEIAPVDADKEDIWADNGFGNIEGELFYYDSVEKNEDSKVIKLKSCTRQIGGEKTKFNKRGTWVRSYVVAEHHNQISDCIMKTQDFIGRNFDTRHKTLDWRIRNLQALDIIFDDFSCPDIDFTFNTLENNNVSGILTEYFITITPPGSISSFRLDFGDGEFTTTSLQGQHRYAINARIDPVVRASNDKCQIIQTPIERSNPVEPTIPTTEGFLIPIPEVPDFPDFTFVPCEVPEPDLNLPPLVVPCISLEGQIGPIPSVITGPTINMVSNVTITSNNPINITQSVVSIIGGNNIPSLIIIDPPIPPTIVIDPPIPPTIVILPPDSNITLELDFTDLPRLEVDWGTPPEMEVSLTMAREVRTPERFAVDQNLVQQFGSEFSDLFEVSNSVKVDYQPVGIPSEIRVLYDDNMKVKLDAEDTRIKIDASGVNIPDVRIYGPESPIPNSISFEPHNLPDSFDLVYRGEAIPIDGSSIPKSIKVEMEKEIPHRIVVETLQPIPHKIIVESRLPDRIVLEGPESIPLSLPEDFFLPVKFPEVMPQMELVYRGSPIELKINMEEVVTKNQEGKKCFMMVPCG